MLRKLTKNGLTNDELVTVYKGYIRPIVEYAAPLWHSGISLTLSDQLESIQKRSSRIILGNKYTHYNQALTTLGLQPLYIRRIKLCTTFVLKSCNYKFNEWFVKSKSSHSMNLRSKRTLHEVPCKTALLSNSPVPYFNRLVNNSLSSFPPSLWFIVINLSCFLFCMLFVFRMFNVVSHVSLDECVCCAIFVCALYVPEWFLF